MTAAMPAAAKRRVLVIEDEILISMLLEDMLADLGHEVAGVVPRLGDALTAVQGEAFDVAILDVHLHGQSAFPVADVADRTRPAVRVCHRLRRARTAGEVPQPSDPAQAVRQGRP